VTRRRSFLALVALLLVGGQHQPPRASAPASGGDTALPMHLADTGLFAPGGTDALAHGVRPFVPQYPLWSDGAAKRRWVRIPQGASIDAGSFRSWEFPVGTRFWKEFSFDGRRVETRLLWKSSPRDWVAASYAWNDAGSDAVLVAEDGMITSAGIAEGRQHSIPSRADCATCHGPSRAPLGFNPLQLSDDRDPRAIHGEPRVNGMVTLSTLLDEGRLSGADDALRHAPPRIAARDPQTRAVVGYLSTNCGACHNGDGAIPARLPSLAYADVMADADRVMQSMLGLHSRWQAPGRPEGTTVLLDPDDPRGSAILLRMRSRRPSSQMPPLGTTLQDREAIDAIGRWIDAVRVEQPAPARPHDR
jgi:mono/diheme cytochrome c family protein